MKRHQGYMSTTLATAAIILGLALSGCKDERTPYEAETTSTGSTARPAETRPKPTATPSPAAAEAGHAAPLPVDPAAVESLLRAVHRLANGMPPSGNALGAKLEQVLDRYVTAGPGKTSTADAHDATNSDIDTIETLLGQCRSLISRAKRPDDPAAQLARDLLVTVASESPRSDWRILASDTLSRFVSLDPEGHRVFTVDASIAAAALERAVYHSIGRKCPVQKDMNAALVLIVRRGLLAKWLGLSAQAHPREPEATITKKVNSLRKQITEAMAVTEDNVIQENLLSLKQALDDLEPQLNVYVEQAKRQAQLKVLITGFLSAVEDEDKAEAARYLSPTSAKQLAGVPSLRAAVCDVKSAKTLSLVGLGHLCRVGSQLVISAQLAVVDESGEVLHKTIELSLAEIDGHFVVGRN